MISVDGDTFVEEFAVTGTLANGRRLESQWAEILTSRDDLVAGLRLYFNPIDLPRCWEWADGSSTHLR